MCLDKIKILFIAMVLFSCTNVQVVAEINNTSIEFAEIRCITSPLEEWNNPGKYSPLNVFDGDVTTCCAEGSDRDMWALTIKLVNTITIDEIHLTNGFAKNQELFKKNNRLKDFSLTIYSETTDINKNIISIYEKEFTLQDNMNYQVLRLEQSHEIKYFSLAGFDVYPGNKWDDTCVSEIEFYYKGKKIEIKNIESEKKKYLKQIENDLKSFFNIKFFDILMQDDTFAEIETYDSVIKYTFNDIEYKKWIYPTKYKIENSKLFLYKNGTWILADYNLDRRMKKERLFINRIVTSPVGEKTMEIYQKDF